MIDPDVVCPLGIHVFMLVFWITEMARTEPRFDESPRHYASFRNKLISTAPVLVMVFASAIAIGLPMKWSLIVNFTGCGVALLAVCPFAPWNMGTDEECDSSE